MKQLRFTERKRAQGKSACVKSVRENRKLYLVGLLPFSRALEPQEASKNYPAAGSLQGTKVAQRPQTFSETNISAHNRAASPASPRPRCGSGRFYSQINQTHLLSGGLSLSVRVLRWFLMEMDRDWSPSLRPAPLWAEDHLRIRLPQPIGESQRSDGLRTQPMGAQRQPGEPTPIHPTPPFASQSRTRRTTERF